MNNSRFLLVFILLFLLLIGCAHRQKLAFIDLQKQKRVGNLVGNVYIIENAEIDSLQGSTFSYPLKYVRNGKKTVVLIEGLRRPNFPYMPAKVDPPPFYCFLAEIEGLNYNVGYDPREEEVLGLMPWLGGKRLEVEHCFLYFSAAQDAIIEGFVTITFSYGEGEQQGRMLTGKFKGKRVERKDLFK